MKHLALAAAVLAFAALPALASEATFERNLTVNGHVELAVSTGSGHIHITKGSGDRVHIFGHVKSNWGSGDDAKVQEIAKNPPIDQTGNIIRIGQRHENYHNISIDYDIEAPANSFLEANSGSGDIKDEGVGENAKLGTGSGSIYATGLQNGFIANTGSGDIHAEQSGGQGDVKVQTGSGSVELKNVHGGLHAGTGSGDIKVSGIANLRLEARNRLRQHRVLGRQYRLQSRCLHWFRLRPLRSGNGGAGIVRPPPHHRQGTGRRSHRPHRRPAPATFPFTRFVCSGLISRTRPGS